MIIKRLTLNNFLSHRDTVIEFPWGVTVFVGPNGAGKTSIIDGIFVALFNQRPRGESWGDIIHRGSSSTRVELEFEEGGIPYRVVWERRKTGTPIYKLYRADTGTLIAEGVHEVQSQLEAITGLDRDSAINSILIRQGEITSLLDQTPAERKKIIGRLIGIDKLERAWKNMGEVVVYFKEKLMEYKRLQFEHDHLTKRLEELQAESQKLEAEIRDLEERIKVLKKQLEDEVQLLNVLEEKRERHTALKGEIERLRVQIKAVEDNLNRVRGELEKAVAARKLMNELSPVVQKLDMLEEIQRILVEIKHLQERKSVLTAELSRIQEIEKTIAETRPAHEEYLKMESEIRSLEEAIGEMQSSRETVVRLEKERENLTNELERVEAKLQELFGRIEEYPVSAVGVEEELLSKSPEELDNEIAELKATVEAYLSRLENLRSELEAAKKAEARLEELKTLVERLPILRDLKNLNMEISELEREMEGIQKVLSKIEQLRETLERLKPSYEKYERITTELAGLEETLNGIRKELERLGQLEVRLKEKELQRGRIEREAESLERDILRFLPKPTSEAKEEKLKELTQEIERIKGELKKHQDLIASLRGRIREIDEYLSLLEGSNVCPVCHREMDDAHKAQVRKEFLEEKTEKKQEISHLEEKVRGLQKRLTELEEIQRALERLDVARYQSLKEELEGLSSEISELRREVEKRNELERKLLDVRGEIDKREARKKEIETDYHRYPLIKEELEKLLREKSEEELRNRLSELKSRLSELEERRSKIVSTLGEVPFDLEGEITKLEKVHEEYLKLKAVAERSGAIEEEIKSTEGEVERIRKIEIPSRLLAEKLILEKRSKKLRENLRQIEAELDVARDDVKKLAELEKKRNELKARLEELKPAHEKYVGSVDALSRERPKDDVLRDVEGVSHELSKLEMEERKLTESLGGVPEDLEAEISRLRKLQEDYIKAREEAKNLDNLRAEVANLEAELKRLRDDVEAKEKELESLGFSERDLKAVQETIRNIEGDIKKLEGKKVVKEGDLEKVSKRIQETEDRIKALEGELKKVERLQKLISDLERIRAAYHRDGVQRLLRQKIAPVISELATEYIENFNMDITDVYLSEDFDITVVKNSTEVPTSTLSGGEKVAVALALRLAIARALSRNLSVVLMDEPTTHLDEERRKDLVEILDRFFKSGGAVPQVVIVTHHPELETVADTLYLVRNVDGVSRVREVESVEEGL